MQGEEKTKLFREREREKERERVRERERETEREAGNGAHHDRANKDEIRTTKLSLLKPPFLRVSHVISLNSQQPNAMRFMKYCKFSKAIQMQ